MSRLQNNGEVENTLHRKLEPWVNNPPDYETMIETYKQYGRIKSDIRYKKREIERVEELIIVDIDKPRSNEAKKAKLSATSELKDELTTLEANLEIIESEVKALEFMKTMFNAANYRTRLSEQYA
jgi:hypothetical protein